MARQLSGRGHEILLALSENYAVTFILEFVSQHIVYPDPPGISGMLDDYAAISSVDDFAGLMHWLDIRWQHQVLDVVEPFVSNPPPDCILSDFCLPAAMLAMSLRVPHHMFAAWPLDPAFPGNSHSGADHELVVPWSRNIINARAGLASHLFAAADRIIVPGISRYDPIKSHWDVHYVGCLDSSELLVSHNSCVPPQTGGRNIFVYLSASDLDYGRFVVDLVQAACRTDADVLISWGGMAERFGLPVGQLSSRVRSTDYVDSRLAMDWANGVVFHGGQNTLMQALSKGLPVAAIPLESDERRWNSNRAKGDGAGIVLERENLKADGLIAALSRLLDDHTLATAARLTAAEVGLLGGAASASDGIEQYGSIVRQ